MDATGYDVTSRWQWEKHIPHVKNHTGYGCEWIYNLTSRWQWEKRIPHVKIIPDMDATGYDVTSRWQREKHIPHEKKHAGYGCDWIWLNMALTMGKALHSTPVKPSKNMFFAMVGLAFTMGKPHPYRCHMIKMINSCCVHNGERFWCDFSGPVVGGVPCGKGDGSKDGGTSGFRCRKTIGKP